MAYPVKIRYFRIVPSPRETHPASPPVILASTSKYRRELLTRLITNFAVEPPNVEELSLAGEPPRATAVRLARAKADEVAARTSGIVIGSDQVAEVEGRALGKPGSRQRAIEQLLSCAGKSLFLYTAVCVVDTATGERHAHVSAAELRFRPLTREMAARYVERDDPVDCAGSFKFESHGVALFEQVKTDDPTAIQGLPLLWLGSCLQRLGVAVL